MNDEHMVAIVSFEGALKREMRRVREQLQRDPALKAFKLEIVVSGRVHDGDLMLDYHLGGQYGEDIVTGNSVQPVIDEYMRRKGWNSQNAPKAIGYLKVPSDDTEVSF